MTVLIIFIIIITIVGLIHHFRPALDKTESGWLLWYNKTGRHGLVRKYKILKWKRE